MKFSAYSDGTFINIFSQAKTVPRFKRHLEGEHNIVDINENDYCVANDPAQEQGTQEKIPKKRGRRPQSIASSGHGEFPEGKYFLLVLLK